MPGADFAWQPTMQIHSTTQQTKTTTPARGLKVATGVRAGTTDYRPGLPTFGT
jgi:hypothetical protein